VAQVALAAPSEDWVAPSGVTMDATVLATFAQHSPVDETDVTETIPLDDVLSDVIDQPTPSSQEEAVLPADPVLTSDAPEVQDIGEVNLQGVSGPDEKINSTARSPAPEEIARSPEIAAPPVEPVMSAAHDISDEPVASDFAEDQLPADATVIVTAPVDVTANEVAKPLPEPIADAPAPAPSPPAEPPTLVQPKRVRHSRIPRAIGRFDSPLIPQFIDNEMRVENPYAAQVEREVLHARSVADKAASADLDPASSPTSQSPATGIFAQNTAIAGDQTSLKSFLELQTDLPNPFAAESTDNASSVNSEGSATKSLPAPAAPVTSPVESELAETVEAQAEAHKTRGDQFRAQGRLEDAAVCYRRALALRPDLREAYTNLADVLQEARQFADAIIVYKQALSWDPDDADLHCSLGEAQLKNGQIEDAVASFRQAVSLRPDFAVAYINLGNALRDLRNPVAETNGTTGDRAPA
jgi:tetratricopeptide (TPR) repeat protein